MLTKNHISTSLSCEKDTMLQNAVDGDSNSRCQSRSKIDSGQEALKTNKVHIQARTTTQPSACVASMFGFHIRRSSPA